MTENRYFPYALDVEAGPKSDTFQWVIRKHGKLLQRSDKSFRSEEDARKNGEKVIEREFSDGIRYDR
jgi:hypothetical protein